MAKYIYKHRRGTSDQWKNTDTKPLEGEIVVELDETNHLHKLKIGDGRTSYEDLAYIMAGNEIVSQVLPRVVNITIADTWTEKTCDAGTYYSQPIALDEITASSRLDLQPDATMLTELQALGIVFVTENIKNKDGNRQIVVNSVGNMPTKSYTMQATVTEVEAKSDNIIGNPVSTTVRPSYQDNILLKDTVTSIIYKLYVSDGKLTMEVNE